MLHAVKTNSPSGQLQLKTRAMVAGAQLVTARQGGQPGQPSNNSKLKSPSGQLQLKTRAMVAGASDPPTGRIGGGTTNSPSGQICKIDIKTRAMVAAELGRTVGRELGGVR
jgi:hypothetical protein